MAGKADATQQRGRSDPSGVVFAVGVRATAKPAWHRGVVERRLELRAEDARDHYDGGRRGHGRDCEGGTAYTRTNSGSGGRRQEGGAAVWWCPSRLSSSASFRHAAPTTKKSARAGPVRSV